MIIIPTRIAAFMQLSAAEITQTLRDNDYQGELVTSAEFQGLTPAGAFVYHCTYPDENTGSEEQCVVYVRMNRLGKLVADY